VKEHKQMVHGKKNASLSVKAIKYVNAWHPGLGYS
jgi:hypothetical protein